MKKINLFTLVLSIGCVAVGMASVPMTALTDAQPVPVFRGHKVAVKAYQESAGEVIVEEDFSLFTAGSEEAPDATDLTEGGMVAIPDNLVKVPGWDGDKIYQAGGMAYIGADLVGTGLINTPLLDLTASGGTFTVSFDARVATGEMDDQCAVISLDYDNPPEEGGSVQYETANLTGEWQHFSYTFSNGVANSFVQIYAYTSAILIDNIKVEQVIDGISAPIALEATDFTATGFTARWMEVNRATSYLLSVFTDVEKDSGMPETTISDDFSGVIAKDKKFMDVEQSKFADGWTVDVTTNGTSRHLYNTEGNFSSAPLSLAFDATGDFIETAQTEAPIHKVSFWCKNQNGDEASRVIVEGFNGSEWVKLTDVVPATLDRAGQVVELQVAEDGIVKVRLSYEKSGGNCSIDDVACVAGGKVTERVFVVEDREETGTSAVVDGLTEGTVYSYYVKAKNDQFVSEPSNIILAKPKAPLAKPQVLPATDVSDWGFRANWEKVEGAEGYRINAYTLHKAAADENYSFTNSYFDRIQLGDEYTIDNPYLDFGGATAISADGYLDCAGWEVINPAYATGYMGVIVSPSGSRFVSPILDLSKGEVTVAFSAVAKGGVTLEMVLVDATTEDGKLIGSEEVTVGDTESEFTVTLPQGTSESVLIIAERGGAANYVFFSSLSVSQQMKEGDTMAVPYLIDWTEKNTYYVKTDKYEGTDDFAYEVEAYRMSEGFVEISPRSEMMVVERHSSVSEDVRTEGRAYADGTVIRIENPQGASVEVFTLGGAAVYRNAGGSMEQTVSVSAPGLYIVRIGTKAVKVAM